MPTQSFEPLLNRDMAVETAKPITDLASPILKETVNYTTNLFARCSSSKKGSLEEAYPILATYLHIIQMTDSIEVLISNGCVAPAELLLRSSFEGKLTLEYLLEKRTKSKKRAIAYKQLKDMAKDRHAQILLTLSTSWCSDTIQKARICLLKQLQEARKLKPKDPEAKLAEIIIESRGNQPELAIELVKVADFFEDIGLLVSKKMLHPPELALEVFAGSIIYYWELYKKFVHKLRDEFQRGDIFEWFEYLYKLSKAYSEAKGMYSGSPETRPRAKQLFRRLANLFK